MKRLLSAYFKISGLCVLIALFIQNLVLKCLFQAGYDTFLPRFLLGVLAGTGIYFVLYKLACWLYTSYFWKLVFRSINIQGTWYHKIVSGENLDYVRLGRTRVTQTFDDIQITGVNYDKDLAPASMSVWSAKQVGIDEEGQLVFTYSTTRGGGEPPQDKTGNMRVVMSGEPGHKPVKLEGTFQDSHPSHLRGSIIWQRHAPWESDLPSMESLE